MTAMSILYSRSDCPHCARARLALLRCEVPCELRELAPSVLPAGVQAVPSLWLADGARLEDSLAILHWAAARRPELQLWPDIRVRQQSIENLVRIIDGPFAQASASYQRMPQPGRADRRDYRAEAEIFLAQLEARLARMPYLVGDRETLADLAILPFIQCFADVDRTWFDISPYRRLRAWLAGYRDDPQWRRAQWQAPLWQQDAPPTSLLDGDSRRASA